MRVLTEKLNNFVEGIGLELIGIIPPKPWPCLEIVLKERLQQIIPFGAADISKRINLELFFPGCRSIICLAMPYLPPGIPVSGPVYGDCIAPEHGIVARFVTGPDYHEVFKKRAEMVVDYLRNEEDLVFNDRIAVDNNPLPEKSLALLCGGMTGEHTVYISPRYGTWVSLGEIMLDVSLPELRRETGSECLRCGRCREACPGGALEGPYGINPRRCFSYLTQAKEDIPENLSHNPGMRIYGCDTCLEVCPLNVGVSHSGLPEYARMLVNPVQYLPEAMNISKAEYAATVKLTAAGWRGRRIWQRNAANALNNIR